MDDTRLGALDVLILVVQGCFIAMKLTDNLDWSWWWVLSPIWGVFALVLALALLGVLGIGTARSGGHVMAFFRRRSRLRRMYEEDPEAGPPEWTTPPAENRWWE